MIDLETIWKRFRPSVEKELQYVVGRSTLPMYSMMRYHMGWVDERGRTRRNTAGKRLRPVLCLLACQSLGGNWRQALPAAAALELVHNFSLIHDDIQDSSPERRGMPTVWSVWGKPQAINVGDAMHALALSSLLRLEETGVTHAKMVRGARILGEASLRLSEGQFRDIAYEKRMDVKMDDYLAMISGKTAALFSGSLEIGAVLATDDEWAVTRLRDFGQSLGMTFQVHDDVLSIWGDEKTTGKPSGSDILMKKKSLPVVCALEKAGSADRERLREVYQQESLKPGDVEEVLGILQRAGARRHAQEIGANYYREAISGIDDLAIPTPAKRELQAVAAFLLEREF